MKHIRQVGINDQTDSNLGQIIKLLNTVTLVTIVFGVLYLFISVFTSQYALSSILVVNTLLVSIVFLLNFKGRYKTSRLYFLSLVNVGLALNCIFFGKESGIQFFFLVSASLPFVFFRHTEKFLIVISVSISLFLFALIQFEIVPLSFFKLSNHQELIYNLSLTSAIVWTVINFHFVTKRNHLAYLEIKEKNESIHNSLEQREVLLKEIHHRVKNNLQIIISLLNLQAHKTEDYETKQLFDESSNRIRSISSVHELLYSTKDFSDILANNYIDRLLSDILNTHQREGLMIHLGQDVDSVRVSLEKSIPIGLIINEIVTNALKHAVIKDEVSIKLSLKELHSNLELTIQDSGNGFDLDEQMSKDQSLGLFLITTLADQIDGKIDFHSDNTGSRYILQFPKD